MAQWQSNIPITQMDAQFQRVSRCSGFDENESSLNNAVHLLRLPQCLNYPALTEQSRGGRIVTFTFLAGARAERE